MKNSTKKTFLDFLRNHWFVNFPWFLFVLGVFGLVCGLLFYQHEIAVLSLLPILISPILCVLKCLNDLDAERIAEKILEDLDAERTAEKTLESTYNRTED